MPNDKQVFDRAPAPIREASVFDPSRPQGFIQILSTSKKGARQGSRNPGQKTVTVISGEIKGINQANRSEQETK